MHLKNALDYLQEKAKITENASVRSTLGDIYSVMLIAGLDDGKRWAGKIETVVEYVEAGNYAFCYQDARKILNKRNYKRVMTQMAVVGV